MQLTPDNFSLQEKSQKFQIVWGWQKLHRSKQYSLLFTWILNQKHFNLFKNLRIRKKKIHVTPRSTNLFPCCVTMIFQGSKFSQSLSLTSLNLPICNFQIYKLVQNMPVMLLPLILHTSSPSFPPLIAVQHFSFLVLFLCPFLQEAVSQRKIQTKLN